MSKFRICTWKYEPKSAYSFNYWIVSRIFKSYFPTAWFYTIFPLCTNPFFSPLLCITIHILYGFYSRFQRGCIYFSMQSQLSHIIELKLTRASAGEKWIPKRRPISDSFSRYYAVGICSPVILLAALRGANQPLAVRG